MVSVTRVRDSVGITDDSQSFAVGYINICGWLTLVTTEGFFAGRCFVRGLTTARLTRLSTIHLGSLRCSIKRKLRCRSVEDIPNLHGGPDLRYLVHDIRKQDPWCMEQPSMSVTVHCLHQLNTTDSLVVYWSILSVFVASVVLLSTSDKTSPEFVFATFQNETGWNDGIAWILGLLQSALSLIGYDAVLHMTEEMPTPSRDAPLAMVYAVGVGGTTGTIFVLVMLFCLTDLPSIVATTTGMPIVELIFQSTNSRAGTTFLTLMLAICFIHGTNGSITSASRLLYAMARDKGVPYHSYFSHIHPKWEVPIRTIVLTWVFNAIFGLLYLGPTVAFNAFISSCTILLNMSYAIPVLTLLVRGRGILTQFQSFQGNDSPWKFGKVRGLIINYIAVLYVFITSFVSFLRH